MANPTHNYTQNAWQGDNYESGLDIKEIAKRLRKHIKDNHSDYKFSVRIERYSGGQSLNIYLTSAPYKVVKGCYTHEWIDGVQEIVYKDVKEQYAQLNHHCLNDYADSDIKNNGYILDDRVIPVLKSVVSFAQGYNYDDSDSMIDYFNTNFYMHLSVGQWDKPCEYPKTERKVANPDTLKEIKDQEIIKTQEKSVEPIDHSILWLYENDTVAVSTEDFSI